MCCAALRPGEAVDLRKEALSLGRLFRGVRGGPLSESLYGRLRATARTKP